MASTKGPTLSFASIFYKGSTKKLRRLFYKNVTHTPFSKTIFTIKGKMESSIELLGVGGAGGEL
jgi:hypothetical protein